MEKSSKCHLHIFLKFEKDFALIDSLLDSYNKGILSHSNDNIDYYGNNVGHIHMVETHLAALQH